jgi:aminoglycoside 6'-N-acetyltransferase I
LQIADLQPSDSAAVEEAAQVLVAGFRDRSIAWPDLAAARAELQKTLAPGKLCRVASDADGSVLGWVGGRRSYARVWELHPLVVHPSAQRRGIGRALVADLELQVRQRGGLTLLLGTDDEDNRTTLGGAELYPNVWPQVVNIRNLRDHPFEFYQKCGFVIVGVVPDANGRGKPDILMAKRVADE